MSGLQGRVAIVTGASRGIGKGCALELGAAGATVYVTGRSMSESDHPLPGTVGATARGDRRARWHRRRGRVLDHRDDDAVAALFERVHEEHGRLDVLVNNAFIVTNELTSGRPFWEVPLSNWDDMIDVGTRSAYVASVFAAQQMVPANARVSLPTSAGRARPSTRGASPTESASARSTASPPTPRSSSGRTASPSYRSGRGSCGRSGSTSGSRTVRFPTRSTSTRPSRPGSRDVRWSRSRQTPMWRGGRAMRSPCATSPSSTASATSTAASHRVPCTTTRRSGRRRTVCAGQRPFFGRESADQGWMAKSSVDRCSDCTQYPPAVLSAMRTGRQPSRRPSTISAIRVVSPSRV